MTIGTNAAGHFFDTTFTTNGVLYSAAAGVITSTAAGTAGEVLTSNGAGSAPTYQSSAVTTDIFSVFLNGNVTNATGDGTILTVAYDTEIVDTANAFNTATSTYTFPRTKAYQINVNTFLFDLDVTQTLLVIRGVINGADNSYRIVVVDPGVTKASNNELLLSGSFIYNATATDTLIIELGVFNGAKTAGIGGTFTRLSGFSIG